MPFSYAEEYLPLLYNALQEELGMYIRTDDKRKLKNVLYDAKDKAGDEALDELMFFDIEPNVIYIAKRSCELPE